MLSLKQIFLFRSFKGALWNSYELRYGKETVQGAYWEQLISKIALAIYKLDLCSVGFQKRVSSLPTISSERVCNLFRIVYITRCNRIDGNFVCNHSIFKYRLP